MNDYLEPEFRQDYDFWKQNPSPKTNRVMLNKMQPMINKAVSAHVGRGDPLVRSRAKKMALEALNSYDPSRARLRTHVTNYLQGLKRYSRQQTQAIPVPERRIYQFRQIENAVSELEDQLGREPSMRELSDKVGLSIGQIQKIQRADLPISESHIAGPEETMLPAVNKDDAEFILEVVYADLSPIDQRILELSSGMHGIRPQPVKEIARRLKRTPGAISQRKAKIQQLIQQAADVGI